MPVAAGFGAAAGGIALDDEYLALGGVSLRAIGQLAGQGSGFKHRFAPGQLTRLARRLARPGSAQATVKDSASDARILFKISAQFLADQTVANAAHHAVAEL
ncbi:hypothetical protein SDC9_196837 [bioreactor metagenome]|uniref:Uncharacterized protein n=1 Tax=bioreactor metagenome TaxID=1076179 RepID=A0A645IEF3_9ZZZZ